MKAIKKWENGRTEEKGFDDEMEMIAWIATSPDAGIMAYDEDGLPIDPRIISEKVEAYGIF